MPKPLLKGTLKTWKEDRGFGFISPENGGRDLFIHITALGQGAALPKPGDVIHYQVSRDRQGKLRAINARVEGVGSPANNQIKSAGKRMGSPLWLKISIAAGILFAVAFGLFMWKTQNLI